MAKTFSQRPSKLRLRWYWWYHRTAGCCGGRRRRPLRGRFDQTSPGNRRGEPRSVRGVCFAGGPRLGGAAETCSHTKKLASSMLIQFSQAKPAQGLVETQLVNNTASCTTSKLSSRLSTSHIGAELVISECHPFSAAVLASLQTAFGSYCKVVTRTGTKNT